MINFLMFKRCHIIAPLIWRAKLGSATLLRRQYRGQPPSFRVLSMIFREKCDRSCLRGLFCGQVLATTIGGEANDGRQI